MSRPALILAALAALMGAAGVALAALGEHAGGGDLGRTAAMFLVLHAGALVGVSAHTRVDDHARALIVAGFTLALGTALFAGDLSARAFAGHRLFPMAAPTGGSLMIVAWLALAVAFAARARR